MPSSLKELSRLVDGLTLVLKEAANHRGVGSFQSGAGDLQTLIKRALLSATDLTGLTKGNLRDFSLLPHPHNSTPKGSVVYFTDQPETPAAHPADLSETPSSSSSSTNTSGGASANANANESSQFVPNVNREPDDVLSAASSSPADAFVEIAAGEAAAVITPPPPPPSVIKRRKLRERRVPSTTFSRALGFAGLGAGLAWGTIQESAKRLVYGTPISQDK